MRNYYIPPTIKEKEKVIGGILTIGQFLFLIVGLVIGLVLGVLLYTLTKSLELGRKLSESTLREIDINKPHFLTPFFWYNQVKGAPPYAR